MDIEARAGSRVETSDRGSVCLPVATGSRPTGTVGDTEDGPLLPETLPAGRATRELGLRREEFELAVQLGHVRTVAGPDGSRRAVSRAEIERLRAVEGFPETLRERARTVGTAEAAQLLCLSPGRFTRLARAGYVSPVRFCLNRYRAVVWLYPAEELRAFAEREQALLTGRFPRTLSVGCDPADDLRPRNWRARRVGHLLRMSEDPWERAAIVSSVLGPVQTAELVRDPCERAYLSRLRPHLAHARYESETARETVGRLLVADRPDEITWHSACLDMLLEEAREVRGAPGTGPWPGTRPAALPVAAQPSVDGKRPPVDTKRQPVTAHASTSLSQAEEIPLSPTAAWPVSAGTVTAAAEVRRADRKRPPKRPSGERKRSATRTG